MRIHSSKLIFWHNWLLKRKAIISKGCFKIGKSKEIIFASQYIKQFIIFKSDYTEFDMIIIKIHPTFYSTTTTKIQAESEKIWKFQLHDLIVDFETRLRLPAPLNFISYFFMLFELIYKAGKKMYKWICRSGCCVKHEDLPTV